MNKTIIRVQFDEPPQPPATQAVKPKFVATLIVISSYQIGQGCKVKKIA